MLTYAVPRYPHAPAAVLRYLATFRGCSVSCLASFCPSPQSVAFCVQALFSSFQTLSLAWPATSSGGASRRARNRKASSCGKRVLLELNRRCDTGTLLAPWNSWAAPTDHSSLPSPEQCTPKGQAFHGPKCSFVWSHVRLFFGVSCSLQSSIHFQSLSPLNSLHAGPTLHRQHTHQLSSLPSVSFGQLLPPAPLFGFCACANRLDCRPNAGTATGILVTHPQPSPITLYSPLFFSVNALPPVCSSSRHRTQNTSALFSYCHYVQRRVGGPTPKAGERLDQHRHWTQEASHEKDPQSRTCKMCTDGGRSPRAAGG